MPKQLSASHPSSDLRVYDELNSAVATDEARSGTLRDDASTASTAPRPRRQPAEQIAERYESILQDGAEAVGCQAAALYLLDDLTGCLHLRSAWRIDADRLARAARPLKECPADLEALSGHVVALEHREAADHWNPPEPTPGALCVPVSSPTTPLGTLWIFSDRERTFDDRQAKLAEIIAGRLASDLERDLLLDEFHQRGGPRRQLATAARWWKSQLPSITPLIDGWELAGWVRPSGQVAGDFYDWFLRPDNALCLAVGDALGRDLDAALAAAALRSAVRAHGQYAQQPHVLLKRVNRTLWTSSAGDQFASLFCAALDTGTGQLRLATAGDPTALVVGPEADHLFSRCETPLGTEPDPLYLTHTVSLPPGHVLAVVTDGVRDALDARGRLWGDAGLRRAVLDHIDAPAADLATAIRQRLAYHTGDVDVDDQSVLIVKRHA